jgi:hypothetical protein
MYWNGTVGEYVQLLQAVYPAVKAADPAALVAGGATANVDTTWIQNMYLAGARGYFDVMAVHSFPDTAYPVDAPDNGATDRLSHVSTLRSLMLNYTDDKPIWITALGWSTFDISASDQAKRLTSTYTLLRNEYPYVRTPGI